MCGVTDPSQIEERLVLYERIRRNRASSIQVLSNFGYDETAPPELSEFLEAEGQPMPGKRHGGCCVPRSRLRAELRVSK